MASSAQQVREHRMRWVLLARVGLAVQRLDAHAPHQRAHVPPPHIDAPQAQQIAQHAAAGERVLQMQLVDAAHQRQLALGNRLGVVVHRASADAQQLGLALDRQFVFALDHRFALSKPALLSAPSKKSTGTSQTVKQRFSVFFPGKRYSWQCVI